MIPSLGRAVHYVLPESHRHKGQHRAATITQVWSGKGQDATEETEVHLRVDLDSLNDPFDILPFMIVRACGQDPHGKQPGTWHEPERVVTPDPKKPALKTESQKEPVHA